MKPELWKKSNSSSNNNNNFKNRPPFFSMKLLILFFDWFRNRLEFVAGSLGKTMHIEKLFRIVVGTDRTEKGTRDYNKK